MKIAVVQKNSYKLGYDKNLALAIDTIKEAKKLNADIVLFPECFLTSYTLPIDNEKAIAEDSYYIKEVCNIAKELKIGVVITAFAKGYKKPRNSAFLIDKKGNIIMKYDKVHTCDFADEKCLENGTEFKVCNFEGVKIGIMICYDREYPESARMLMLKGAEIVLVPNNCQGMKPRLNALQTRAYENMFGVVMANPPYENAGNSCAFSPIAWDDDGNCANMELFTADELSEKIYIADYNIEELRAYRNSEMMGNTFRKVDAYEGLLSKEIKEPFIRY